MRPVLIIDDDDDIREILSYALESEGMTIKTFPDAKKALKFLSSLDKEDLPSFIIVDYLMPKMTGVEFIWALKKYYPESLGKVPAALSSAMGEFDPKLKQLKELIVISKPFNMEELLKLVKRYCF